MPGTVTFINPEQTLYYMAAPENSRKVGGDFTFLRGVWPCRHGMSASMLHL